jgi:hypothetical protein
MEKLHDKVKFQLQESNNRYKQQENLRKREVNFEVGDLVLGHLRKELFPKAEYKKLKLEKIGPCRVLRNSLQMHMNWNFHQTSIFLLFSILQTYILIRKVKQLEQQLHVKI